MALFHFSGVGATLDRAFFDAASRRPWRAPPLDVSASALVLIDDNTLAEAKQKGYGLRWPFPRGAFAALIVALHRAGAESIVMDFTFLDPSDFAEQDALLATVAAVTPSVILARTEQAPPVFWDDQFVAAHPAFFQSIRMGNTEFHPDADGTARRYQLQNSLAAAAARIQPPPGQALLRWHGGLEEIRRKGVPVLSAARFFNPGLHMLDRLTQASFNLESLAPEAAALQAALSAEPDLRGGEFDAVRGRTVFIGANAAGTFDLKAMPVGQLEPGVLLHWTAWTNLRHGSFVRDVPRLVAFGLAIGVVLLLGAVGVRGQLGRAVAAAVLLVVAALAAAYYGISAGWFLAPATPAAAALLALTGVAAEGLWVEQRRRREVQTMFGSYVDPGVVDLLVRDPHAIRLGGERREATVFFCDLAGFTDLSEQVSPEALLALINHYLEETSDCLRAHGAYIDKYIGDAIMAVFGAPQQDPEHALSAGRAALAAQEVLARLNTRLAAEHGRTLSMRIGLNTGEMIVGNLGSPRKRNYTVLGDAVNLASRLEGANKEFGTAILVGEETARQIGDRLILRPLTRLRVKGKQRAVEVSELIATPETVAPEMLRFLTSYRAGYTAYVAGNFAAAVLEFTTANEFRPDDLMAKALLADARRLVQAPPPVGWEPTITLTSK